MVGVKGRSGITSEYLKAKRANEALDAAEKVILRHINGHKTDDNGVKIDDLRIKMAYQLYLKRIPLMTEEIGNVTPQAIINIIKDSKPEVIRIKEPKKKLT